MDFNMYVVSKSGTFWPNGVWLFSLYSCYAPLFNLQKSHYNNEASPEVSQSKSFVGKGV